MAFENCQKCLVKKIIALDILVEGNITRSKKGTAPNTQLSLLSRLALLGSFVGVRCTR